MKRTMLVPFFAGILSVCISAGSSPQSSEILHTPRTATGAFQMVQSSDSLIVFEFNLPQVRTERVEMRQFGTGCKVILDDDRVILPNPGTPDIQAIWCMVQIPNTGNVALEYTVKESKRLLDYSVAPRQKQPPIGSDEHYSYAFDAGVYATDALHPKTISSVIAYTILREIRVATIGINPVRYNPVTGELNLITRVRITIRPAGGRGLNELSIVDKDYTPSFKPLYRNVLNFDHAGVHAGRAKPGCYLFIGNQTTLDAVKDLINWKIRRGYDVHTAVTGSDSIPATTQGIDAWIEKVYGAWPNKPEYILLVGNEKVIPPRIIYPQGNKEPSDNIFGVIGTSGKIPSIHVGRITGNKSAADDDDPAVLQYQAWKILMHEREPFEGDWFTKGETWGCKHMDGITIARAWAATMKKGLKEVPTGTDQDADNKTTADDVVKHFDAGVSLYGYVGHGITTEWYSLGFKTTHIQSLNNGRKLPWIASIACYVAAFNNRYCFVENFMAEGSINNPKGALGMFAFSVVGNDMINSQIGNLLKAYFEQNLWHMGACATYGKQFPGDTLDDQDGSMVWGCPETDIYTINPLKKLTVTHPNQISGEFSVTVFDQTVPVKGAMVGVVTNTNKPLAGGFTDTTGIAKLPIAAVPAGTDSVYITVTCHNSKPYLGAMKLSSSGIAGTLSSSAPFTVNSIHTDHQGSAHFSFTIPHPGTVRFEIFNMRGSRIISHAYTCPVRGNHSIEWNRCGAQGNAVPNGIYMVTISYGASKTSSRLPLFR